ncbi:hypothetical protein MTO96_015384 [Rhipicephalus appendiculatus]
MGLSCVMNMVKQKHSRRMKASRAAFTFDVEVAVLAFVAGQRGGALLGFLSGTTCNVLLLCREPWPAVDSSPLRRPVLPAGGVGVATTAGSLELLGRYDEWLVLAWPDLDDVPAGSFEGAAWLLLDGPKPMAL